MLGIRLLHLCRGNLRRGSIDIVICSDCVFCLSGPTEDALAGGAADLLSRGFSGSGIWHAS
jgi:hypothetical protein